ncbi:MAG: N-acetylmuramoyl-L-alanine amidase [Oscillospiraceae bacterium]|jgi:N-acetylmuramoyl-L-alanine amidase|nr:N-acetylmuramoyl-L-alanine amidase [Oscillospiraceae bacterium]
MKKTQNVIFWITLLIGYIIFALLMKRAYHEVDKQIIKQQTQNFPLMIIDAGHGGEDSGTISAKGVYEKDINLKVAKILKDLMLSSGFEVIMTRETDTSIYDKTALTLRQRKVSDLNNRLKIANSNKNAILVSIHQNSIAQKTCKGSQVFYSTSDKFSQILAENVKKTFNLIDPKNKRQVRPANNDIFLLKNVKTPAILVECGFLSNPEEAEKLTNFNYQKQVAFAIFLGYIEYSKIFN